MKLKIKLFSVLGLLILSINTAYSKLSDDFIIEIDNQNFSYEEIFDFSFVQNSDLKIEKVSLVMESEFEKTINLIKTLSQNTTPENRIEKFKLQKKLAILVDVFFFGRDFVISNLKELRSIGYPIADDEFESPWFNNTHFDRAIFSKDLINLTNKYPDTEYEKEALYLISTEMPDGESFGSAGYYHVSLEYLIYKIQAANLFLEKYPNDSRIDEVKEVFENTKKTFETIDEKDFEDAFIQNMTEYYLNNGEICIDSDRYTEPCYNISLRPGQPKTYYVKKNSLSEILEKPLGEGIEIINVDLPKEEKNDEENYTEKETKLIGKAMWRGYLQGYPDGTLKLENPVNRAEFAKMLMMAFEQGDGNVDNIKKFPDVQTAEWYAKPLAKAVELEIMQGYPDGNMKPAETIIMIEAVKMVLETKYPEEDFTPSILSKWYSEYLSFIKENFPEISFVDGDLEHAMTRGECVELIEGIIEN